jgi:glyoxylase-like metal-dependent hydrolase (beta-lactamase superfamily II)
MPEILPHFKLIDLEYLGYTRLIAACILETESGVVIVDPGPSSSLPMLLSRLQELGVLVKDIYAIVLTHVHLDHAGATGTLVKRNPGIRVFVHEKGAKHMIDPDRLLESAARIYGGDMNRLLGECVPVPPRNVTALTGGEQLSFGKRRFRVMYTPGHASHHIGYLDLLTGVAFVGDTAGVRIGNGSIVPVTPPPDVDLENWRRSLEQIGVWKPERLFLTHFGLSDSVDWHLREFKEKLESWAGSVRASLQWEGNDEEKAHEFALRATSELRAELQAETEQISRYELSAGFIDSWYGLARYWRKGRFPS